MQTELLTKQISTVGEAIPHELGAQMIQDYQKTNPLDTHWYIIGTEIISKILAQPGCAGIRFYNAINEKGEKTLVYVGLDANGQDLIRFSSVNDLGLLETGKAIVADRAGGGRQSPPGEDGWWQVD